MKEIVFVVVLELSLDLRIGCEFWSLWIAVWRCEMFGALEERRASMAMPVPPGTAWHQLYLVPHNWSALGLDTLGIEPLN